MRSCSSSCPAAYALAGSLRAASVSLVHHRRLGAASYGSIALLKPSRNAATLSKTRMAVRATPIGVTSFEFPAPKADGGSGGEAADFVAWAFTRNPAHCATLGEAVDGCTVVQEHEAARDGYLTYCERVYLNPATATGPPAGGYEDPHSEDYSRKYCQ